MVWVGPDGALELCFNYFLKGQDAGVLYTHTCSFLHSTWCRRTGGRRRWDLQGAGGRTVAGHPCPGNFLECTQIQSSSTEPCQVPVKARSHALCLGIKICWRWLELYHPGLQGPQTLLRHPGACKKEAWKKVDRAVDWERSPRIHANSAVQLRSA